MAEKPEALAQRSLAHSENTAGKAEDLHDHLTRVAVRAGRFAAAFGCEAEGCFAGILHDVGKYGELFQRRVRGGPERGIDHWSMGAWLALTSARQFGVASALAIQGHHLGLQWAEDDELRALDPARLRQSHPRNLRLSESGAGPDEFLQRTKSDRLELPQLTGSVLDWVAARRFPVAAMLDIRMLFSALVDADYLETERHFNARTRPEGLELNAPDALASLLAYVGNLERTSSAPPHVRALRSDLIGACRSAARSAPGLFTLTAPTGSGKTLGMLAFALEHAVQNPGIRRIVTVIPYLSIIEQTAAEYRKVFAKRLRASDLGEYVLEHHSMAGTRDAAGDDGEPDRDGFRLRELSENWDAPLVVTTSVQFFESLFADRPSACRKLHRLAGSVILFDEVQTLPVHLAVPTLAALSRLAERHGVTVVLSTATQPAFAHLSPQVERFCSAGWKPKEIVPDPTALFARARRTRIRWPEPDARIGWEELADRLTACPRALCIVNLRRHALSLYKELDRRGTDGLLHMSTRMCPAHRTAVLSAARARLAAGEPCVLVSTQCVEAGVDIDFPVVYRADGPLEAVAQAAGRCNRNGHAAVAEVVVFRPEDDGRRTYPDGAYQQAAETAHALLRELGADRMDIHDPALFQRYYRSLYGLVRPGSGSDRLTEAISDLRFPDVARMYRLIEQNTINILVPYDDAIFGILRDDLERERLTRTWIARARPHSVGWFLTRDDPVTRFLKPVPVAGGRPSGDWFVYLNADHYHPQAGLVIPTELELLTA